MESRIWLRMNKSFSLEIEYLGVIPWKQDFVKIRARNVRMQVVSEKKFVWLITPIATVMHWHHGRNHIKVVRNLF